MKYLHLCITASVLASFAACGTDFVVNVTPASVYPGGTASVSWSAPSTASTFNDWIGIYPTGKPFEATRLTTIYGTRSGSFNVLFNTLGDYQIQYFDSSGVGRSAPTPVSVQTGTNAYAFSVPSEVALGTQAMLTFQSDTNLNVSGDTIGYCAQNNPSTIVAAASVDGAHSGTMYFTMSRPGTFVFNYFKLGNVNNPMCQPVVMVVPQVPVQPSITLIEPNITVSWFGYRGASYDVLASTNLLSPVATWTKKTTKSGTNGTLTYSSPHTSPSQFFAIQELWP